MLKTVFAMVLTLQMLILPSPLGAEEEPPIGPSEAPLADVGLDPGHSDLDVGAAGGGLRETDLTLAVAFRVRELLEEKGLGVAMSREDNRPLTDFSARDSTERTRLEQEARIAAVGRTRVYVSIHFNGFGDPKVRGAEVYYNGENHGEESRSLAHAIQGSMISEVRAAGYAVPDRGVKEDLWAGKPYGHFFSLRGDSPSVLVEAMFLSNPQEAALLLDEAIKEAVAAGIAGGIGAYLAQQPSP